MVPPLVGLTDQTRTNPGGGLGEALKVVVEPGATLAEAGSTVSFRATGIGFGDAFSTCEPFPQLVRIEIANASPNRIATAGLPSFTRGIIPAKDSDIWVPRHDI